MSATATLVTPTDAKGRPQRKIAPGESAFDRTRRRSYRLFVAPALIVFAAVVLLRSSRLPDVTKIVAVIVLAALVVSCQFGKLP